MYPLRITLLLAVGGLVLSFQASRAGDNGVPVDQAKYANRPTLPDFTAEPCPDNPA